MLRVFARKEALHGFQTLKSYGSDALRLENHGAVRYRRLQKF